MREERGLIDPMNHLLDWCECQEGKTTQTDIDNFTRGEGKGGEPENQPGGLSSSATLSNSQAISPSATFSRSLATTYQTCAFSASYLSVTCCSRSGLVCSCVCQPLTLIRGSREIISAVFISLENPDLSNSSHFPAILRTFKAETQRTF